VTRFAPEVVFHLAAQPLVRFAHADPLQTFSTNVMGTAHLMQALRSAPSVKSAVIMTTDKVYENREHLSGYREDDRLGGFEPYGCSKACAEHVVDAFRHSYFDAAAPGIGIATVRAGNVIGGGDWSADRLIPDAIRAFAAGTPLHIRSPDAVRPWQHVLDPINGMLLLAERLAGDPADWQGGWNMGPPEHEFHPVSAVADAMVQSWGDGARWTGGAAADDAPHEARLLTLNPSKAMARLGWRQRWPFQRALAATVEWYKTHQAGGDPRAFSEHQIEAFEGAN
jgi:CDP-glucose 4,6-dehydratase